MGRTNGLAQGKPASGFGAKQESNDSALCRNMVGSGLIVRLIEAVLIVWIHWGQELGERTNGAEIRGLWELNVEGAKCVEINEVSDQRDIQHFTGLLEIIVLVNKLERLRSVVKGLVVEIRHASRLEETPPHVAATRKSRRLGPKLAIGLRQKKL